MGDSNRNNDLLTGAGQWVSPFELARMNTDGIRFNHKSINMAKTTPAQIDLIHQVPRTHMHLLENSQKHERVIATV